MNSLIKITGVTGGMALVSVLITGLVFAGPSGGDFEMVSSTIDGGGGTSIGGDFGGFWANPASEDHLFKSGYE